jgi:exopolysaccharide biosynthesis polyprenyl glycosylphosphotransferase
MTMGRGLYTSWLRGERARGRFVQSVAVVAYREEADRLVNLVTHHPELGLQICAMASDGETAIRHGIPWLGQPNHALDGVLRSGATTALVSSAGMAPDEYNRVIQGLVRNGVHVQLSSGLRKVDHRRLQRVALANEAFFSLAPSGPSPVQLALKRAVDLIIATAVLVVSAPVVAATAIAIKLQDRGPVFFRQTRVGHNGQLFTLLKFRTMVIDAEARLAELRSENQRHGPLFKVDSDPRVTRLGRLLRASSLDELPQLFNVLAGSMSLVGPRPALPTEVATFDDDLLRRHDVPPGITGLWQVEARENPSFEAYRHFDLFYVENWSCALDLVLLWATIPSVLTRAVRSLLRGREVVYGQSFNTQPVSPLDPQASTARDAVSVGA